MDIASLLEVEMNDEPNSETIVSENKEDIKVLKPSQIVSNDEMSYYRRVYNNDVSQVRFKRIHCTACDVHIGSAPSEAGNLQEHPVLKTLLCRSCRDFYGDGNFEQGDDATDMFCRWCANGGNLYCCSYCSNTFCDKCIKRNFDSDIRDKIEADERWKCFVCDPVDLYALRSLCRAIRHHVVTLARILMADRIMTAKEIETKMELDDTKCCVGRQLKRKRNESSSGDEYMSSTSAPKRNRSKNRWNNSKRRKSGSQHSKSGVTMLNGTSRFIPIAPRYVLQEMVPSTTTYRNDEDDIPPQLLNCEQTMIEGENETVTPQGVILPVITQPLIPDSVLYNNTISLSPLSPKRPPGILNRNNKTLVPMRPLRKVQTLPPGTTPQPIHRFTNFPIRPAPMVTIPSVTRPPMEINNPAPRFSSYLRCKSNLTTEPSVIDLESDTDDPVIVESETVPNNKEPDHSNSQEYTIIKLQDSQPKLSTHTRRKIFDETINNPILTIDSLLEKLKERLKYELEGVTDIPKDNEIHNARVKIKIINQSIDDIVNELAAFNNSLIRQYKPWAKSQTCMNEDEDSIRPIILKTGERSNKYIPLNMECIHDSDLEVENEEKEYDEDYSVNFSDRFVSFKEKDTINQGTSTHVDTEDKATQAYDTVIMDYDKTISYSLIMQSGHDYKRKESFFESTHLNDEHFGKYEEEFISYLQHFEDQRDFNEKSDQESISEEVELIEIINADLALAQKCRNAVDNNHEIKTIPSESSADVDINTKTNNVDDKHNTQDKLTSCEVLKSKETVIAVETVVEKETHNDNISNKWRSEDDECTILE